jgi:hypothetical protein
MPLIYRTAVLVSFSMLSVLGSAVLGCGAPPPSDGDAAEIAAFHDEGLRGRFFDNALSRTEERIVLKLVDDICGDTWCEGDNDFRFRRLLCDSSAATCSLMFQIGLRESAASAWRWQTCRTGGFIDFDSLVETTSGGYQWLTHGYYEALSACIGEL